MNHEHTFRIHIGVPVFNGTGMAWVRGDLVLSRPRQVEIWMWRCTGCGEQGYEVPA